MMNAEDKTVAYFDAQTRVTVLNTNSPVPVAAEAVDVCALLKTPFVEVLGTRVRVEVAAGTRRLGEAEGTRARVDSGVE